MSEVKSETFYYCDVCGDTIIDHNRKNTFYFNTGWQSGSHSGYIERRGDVCSRCVEGDFKPLKKFLGELFVKEKKKTGK